jgi:hypothetical protein
MTGLVVTRRLAAVAMLGVAAACAGAQPSAERHAAFCAGQGLEPGSELFLDCVQQQRVKEQIEAQRIRDMRGLRPPDR